MKVTDEGWRASKQCMAPRRMVPVKIPTHRRGGYHPPAREALFGISLVEWCISKHFTIQRAAQLREGGGRLMASPTVVGNLGWHHSTRYVNMFLSPPRKRYRAGQGSCWIGNIQRASLKTCRFPPRERTGWGRAPAGLVISKGRHQKPAGFHRGNEPGGAGHLLDW